MTFEIFFKTYDYLNSIFIKQVKNKLFKIFLEIKIIKNFFLCVPKPRNPNVTFLKLFPYHSFGILKLIFW
jgi:hypothetical protein